MHFKKVKVIPITLKGRRGAVGFYTLHFSVSRQCYDAAYLLVVAVFTFATPKEDSYSFTATT